MKLRGHCHDVIALTASVQTEDRSNDKKGHFYMELQHSFEPFQKYHVKILLGDCN